MMKLWFILPFIVTVSADAKDKYMQQLLKKAVRTTTTTNNHPLRHLQDEEEEAFIVNIATYSVKFEQCQFIESLVDENATTVIVEAGRFVRFRLCDNCSTCNSGDNYGEYLVDLRSYLQFTTEYFMAYEVAKCDACYANCTTVDTAITTTAAVTTTNGSPRRRDLGTNQFYNIVTDCKSCVDECEKIDNMEANGYIDATNFIECTLIYAPADDDNAIPLYAGPICVSSGTQIKIGVFTDEYCQILDETKEVDDYLAVNGVSMNLANLILKRTYTDTCISCQEQVEQNENAKGDATEDVDVVIEMCEQLYNQAVKCETAHGFVDGIANYYGYENQLAHEDIVCEHIASSLTTAGTSNETAIIDINLSPSTPTLVPTSNVPSATAPMQSNFATASNMPSDSLSNMPSDALSTMPSDTPTSDVGIFASAQCVDNSQCAMLNLTGACCPTVDDWTLRCCGEPNVPFYQACTNHSKCVAFDLEDACCPTADGKWLDCCGTVPDECQAPGACPLYSTTQYKLDLAAAAENMQSNAVTTTIVSSLASAIVLVVTIAFVAL